MPCHFINFFGHVLILRQHAADVRKTVSAVTQGQEPPRSSHRSPSRSTVASVRNFKFKFQMCWPTINSFQ